MAAEIEGVERIVDTAAEMIQRVQRAEMTEEDSHSIGVVAVAVEINSDEEDGPGYTQVFYRCSDSRRWIQRGLFDEALRAVDREGAG